MKSGFHAERHVKALGRLWIVYGALITLGAIAGAAVLIASPGERQTLGELLLLFLLISAPGTIGGFGLLRRRRWARTLVLVLGAVNLVSFPPFGTALGAYTLWVLLRREDGLSSRGGSGR